MTIQLAVLDMAGTTVADGGLVLDAFGQALAAVGMAADEPAMGDHLAYVHATMGSPKIEVFTALLGDRSRAEAAVQAFDSAVAEAVAADQVQPLPGAEATLGRLRGADVKICLTTGFSGDLADLLVDALGWRDRVDLVLAPAAHRRGRPHPDLVLAAVLALEVEDVRAVAVVGDTANDLWSGTRAGAGVVAGVLTGAHGRTELEAAPHTHILDSITQLPAAIGLDLPAGLGSPG